MEVYSFTLILSSFKSRLFKFIWLPVVLIGDLPKFGIHGEMMGFVNTCRFRENCCEENGKM